MEWVLFAGVSFCFVMRTSHRRRIDHCGSGAPFVAGRGSGSIWQPTCERLEALLGGGRVTSPLAWRRRIMARRS